MSHSPEIVSEDPRAKRSRRRLREALMSMLAREDLLEIGVAELCREAGVHRTTFYGHYDSVGELAADVYASIIDEASVVDPPAGTPLPDAAEAYLRAAETILVAAGNERDAVRTLLGTSVSLTFRRRLRDYFLRRATIAIDVLRDGGYDVPQDTEVEAAFIAGGVVSSIELWVSTDHDDITAFARRMIDSMPAWWPRP